MPFITSKVNITLGPEQISRLTRGLGKAIEHVPGKSEASLMVGFESGCQLFLRGDRAQPIALVTAAVFDNASHRGYRELSEAITGLFVEVLAMDPSRVYVKYEDIPAWSVAGHTFSTGATGKA